MNITELLEWGFETPLKSVLSVFVAVYVVIAMVAVASDIVDLIDDMTNAQKDESEN